jgi:hypothetical protein
MDFDNIYVAFLDLISEMMPFEPFIISALGNKPHESMSFRILRVGSRALQH